MCENELRLVCQIVIYTARAVLHGGKAVCGGDPKYSKMHRMRVGGREKRMWRIHRKVAKCRKRACCGAARYMRLNGETEEPFFVHDSLRCRRFTCSYETPS